MRELELFISKQESEGKALTTLNNYRRYNEEFIRILDLNSENLSKLNELDIDVYTDYLTKKGNVPNSRKTKVACVRCWLNYLKSRKVIEDNFMAETKILVQQVEVPTIDIDGAKMLLEVAKKDYKREIDTDAYPIMLTLFTSGLRIDKELMDMKVGDIHDGGITVVGKGNKVRFVPIPEVVIDTLSEYIRNTRSRFNILDKKDFEIAQSRFSYKGFLSYEDYVEKLTYAKDNNYVFLTECGTKRDNKTVFLKLRKYAKKCGIKTSVSAHKWRHTYATNLLEQNVPMDVISTLLGHADVGITHRIYAKTSKERLVNAVSNVNFDI